MSDLFSRKDGLDTSRPTPKSKSSYSFLGRSTILDKIRSGFRGAGAGASSTSASSAKTSVTNTSSSVGRGSTDYVTSSLNVNQSSASSDSSSGENSTTDTNSFSNSESSALDARAVLETCGAVGTSANATTRTKGTNWRSLDLGPSNGASSGYNRSSGAASRCGEDSGRNRSELDLHGLASRLRRIRMGLRDPPDTSRRSSSSSDASSLPESHFTGVSVTPTAEDMVQTDAMSNLRKNKSFGAYADVEEYLDTQFCLLREDMLNGLRSGITQLRRESRAQQANPANDRKLSVKAVYRKLKITYPTFGKDGINFFVRLDMDQSLSKRILQGATKNLMTGSLLCFSNDGFTQNYLFATVADYDVERLQTWQGFLISFLPESLEAYRRMDNKAGPFIAVESEAYMEAYVHVLSRLQNMCKETFPMEKYIVSCETTISRPSYLKYLLDYKISTAAKDGWAPLSSAGHIAPELLGFNSSQCEAYLSALSQEFSIIQGPPGTGKTYVGLKIIKTILHNLYSDNAHCSPILVVCYTNHALDQFLEGILEFCCKDDVVRIGGGSKSKKTKQCVLKEHRAKTPSECSKRYAELMSEKESIEIKYRLDSMRRYLERANRSILRLRDLSIPEHSFHRQLQSFNEALNPPQPPQPFHPSLSFNNIRKNTVHKEKNALEFWLECDAESFLERYAPNMVKTKMAVSEKPPDTIDMKTEAEIEVEKREINEDGFTVQELTKGQGDKQKETNENEDFQTVGLSRHHQARLRRLILSNIGSDDIMTEQEVKRLERTNCDIITMALKSRWRLYRYWVDKCKSEISESVWRAVKEYKEVMNDLAKLRVEMNIAVMKQCKVIGMTTTGAAKYQSSIQVIQPPVVIVEEAAEVLEAHITAALTQGCQQLILIGDHKQLRPRPTVYELAKNYNLDLSMFERLVNNKLPLTTLNTQHRMRPEISKFMRHIYNPLHDHSSVEGREPIRGITKSVYFLDHQSPEMSDPNATSRSNPFEADMIAGLTRYLVQQDYSPEDITIIAMYTCQMYDLRDRMKSDLNGVQITSVDNYQGEENKIIILSLVRSNVQDVAGFVKIANRVCVSLSRARDGMFVFGNFQMFSRVSGLWTKIVNEANVAGELSNCLNLCCVNHGVPARIRQVKDFELYAPDGGCTKLCKEVLECSHICRLKCHYTHNGYKCLKRCKRRHEPCNHPCRLKCFEDCGKCCKPVTVRLDCGHSQTVPCYVTYGTEPIKCLEPCPEILVCGHSCKERCSAICTLRCAEDCPKPLACGHRCLERCSTDCTSQCGEPCPKPLPCGHKCLEICSTPCTSRCEVVEPHQCKDCLEYNQAPCWARELTGCEKPCSQVLDCGHKCPGICTECKLNSHSACDKPLCQERLAKERVAKEHIAKECVAEEPDDDLEL